MVCSLQGSHIHTVNGQTDSGTTVHLSGAYIEDTFIWSDENNYFLGDWLPQQGNRHLKWYYNLSFHWYKMGPPREHRQQKKNKNEIGQFHSHFIQTVPIRVRFMITSELHICPSSHGKKCLRHDFCWRRVWWFKWPSVLKWDYCFSVFSGQGQLQMNRMVL